MLQFPSLVVLCASGAAVIGALSESRVTHVHDEHVAHNLRCSVVARDFGDAVEIAGKVTADRDVEGAYALQIRNASGAGHALIDQTGDFSVMSGRTTTIGQTTLGGTIESYDAELDLFVDGQRLRCFGIGARTDI